MCLFACGANKKTSTQQEQIIDTNEATTGIYKTIDVSKFKKKLSQQTEALTAKEVMRLYYPIRIEENSEGNATIEVTERKLNNGNTEVTLVHDNMLDDSIKSEKCLMELKKSQNKSQWEVVSLKKSWKCNQGRGQQDWAAKYCR